MRENEFEKWFVAQFGSRPSQKSIPDLQAELDAAKRKLNQTEVILHFTEEWERRKDAALKAKIAFEGGSSSV